MSGITLQDDEGHLGAAYGFDPATDGCSAGYLIRPDGYIGYRSSCLEIGELLDALSRTMTQPRQDLRVQ
ncbi:MAG: hypothetical protein ABI251_11730 [Mycobacteriaceae bacterium]